MKKRVKRRFWRSLLIGLGTIILMLSLIYARVSIRGNAFIFNQIDQVPECEVAVILGTSQYLRDGRTNLYFHYRMETAAALYQAGKVKYLLVSGDNSTRQYNEPKAMKKALEARGVPSERIVLDYAGFRTLDSMLRAHKIFGQSRFIVISQAFHNQRAVYIARHYNIEAYGLNARDVAYYGGLKTRLREVLARAKMMIDLYILKTEPRYLGQPENLPEITEDQEMGE